MTLLRTESGTPATLDAYPVTPDPQRSTHVTAPPDVTSAPSKANRDSSLRSTARQLLADRWAVQIDAYTWRRYALMKRFLPHGPINALNIGTGGGVETLRLLRTGNRVTTIDVDQLSARRTRARAERSGYADRHQGKVGHILQVDVSGPFQFVLMSEVLEHIADDFGALGRIADWLAPGGRLVLSTPTAAHGMLPGDTLSTHEDGGHVRPGYDGPELDVMLARLGFVTLHRLYNCGTGCCWQHRVERRLRGSRVTRLLGYAFGVVCRPMMPLLDRVSDRPSDQITIAAKLP